MTTDTVRVHYDRDDDILHVSLGEPVPHYYQAIPGISGAYTKHAMSDGRICGAMVFWYSLLDPVERVVVETYLPLKVDAPDVGT